MSSADTLIWTVGRDPVLRTTIVAVLVLDQAPAWEDLQRRVRALTEELPRFRSRAKSPLPVAWGRPTWVESRAFDLDLHLRRMVAPPPATLRTVLDLAQVMGTTAFDPELPLWEVVVVEGLDRGQAACVIKLHHAVVDGVGGIAVLLNLLDRVRRPQTAPGTSAGASADGVGSGTRPPVSNGGTARLIAGWAHVKPVSRQLLDTARRTVTDPVGQISRTWRTAESVGRLLAPARRPFSPLMTQRSLGRRFEVFDLPAGLLHDTSVALGCSVNDIFLAAVLGGLGRYHAEHDVTVEQLRVLMPVNVRDDSHAAGGNHFVPARFALPALGDPLERLRRVHDIAGSWKHAPGLAMSNVLAGALDLLPPAATTALWGSMLKGDDFVVTNVPGPPFETYLAGAHVDRFYAFAPASGAAVNVALLTPAGEACVGVNIDTAAIADSDVLVRCLRAGCDEMFTLARERKATVPA